jgi:endonuclease/exonuclease/phosphatase family metal-dependent hydrolase
MGLLRCLSFNIWKNEGDYPRRMAAIGNLLRELQPDVVALQECFVAPALEIDSAKALAGKAWHLTRYPARAKRRWHNGDWQDSRSDMAILSREVPLASGMVALPGDARDGERGLLWVDLPIAGGRIRLGCTHLTHLHDETAQACRKTQAAAAMAALLPGESPAILMGDLNATSSDPALAAIFGHPAICPEARERAQVPSGDAPANGAIDHVLLFTPGVGQRLVSRRIAAAPDVAGHPSDHPAILAEIAIS